MNVKKGDKFNLLIKAKDGSVVRICNILTMREKVSNNVYEYKITFPFSSGWKLLKNVNHDSVNGVKSPIEKLEVINSNVEVCYHSKGCISYKFHKEHKKEKTKPFNDLGDYCHFLRLSSVGLKEFPILKRNINNNDDILEIPNLANKSFSVDFYLGCLDKPFKLKPDIVFKNNYQFSFMEEVENIYLLLHFYEAKNISGVFIKIISNEKKNNYV